MMTVVCSQKHTAEYSAGGAVDDRHLRFDERVVPDRTVGPGNDFRACCGGRKYTA